MTRFHFLVGIVSAFGVALPVCAATLNSYRDHRRVLLVFAPQDSDESLARQISAIRPLLDDKDDRDLNLVEVTGATVTGASDGASRLRRRYAVAAGRFAVLLIGKDGLVALRSDRPVAGERLAARIDAMPMRQDELRRH